jgi:phosphoribosylformylglycinamidine cyclo-ligase
MLRVFNCGIGMVLVVRPGDVPAARSVLDREGVTPLLLGRIIRSEGAASVEITGPDALFS